MEIWNVQCSVCKQLKQERTQLKEELAYSKSEQDRLRHFIRKQAERCSDCGTEATLRGRVRELEDRPDHGALGGVQLPAWMWVTKWKRKAYVIGRGICGSQYAEVNDGLVSYLPIGGVEPYTGQDKGTE